MTECESAEVTFVQVNDVVAVIDEWNDLVSNDFPKCDDPASASTLREFVRDAVDRFTERYARIGEIDPLLQRLRQCRSGFITIGGPGNCFTSSSGSAIAVRYLEKLWGRIGVAIERAVTADAVWDDFGRVKAALQSFPQPDIYLLKLAIDQDRELLGVKAGTPYNPELVGNEIADAITHQMRNIATLLFGESTRATQKRVSALMKSKELPANRKSIGIYEVSGSALERLKAIHSAAHDT